MYFKEVAGSARNRDILVYVAQADELHTAFEWDEGLVVYIYVRHVIMNRYRLLTNFSFQDGIMPWSVSIDAGSLRYTIDTGDESYIRYADISLTATGRSRAFYEKWGQVTMLLILYVASAYVIYKTVENPDKTKQK